MMVPLGLPTSRMGDSSVPMQPRMVMRPAYVPVSKNTTSPAASENAFVRLVQESFGESLEVPVFAELPATEQ